MTTGRRVPRRQSITRRLVMLLLTVGLLPLLALAGINNYQSAQALQRQVETQMDELAASSIDKLDRTLADRYADARAFANDFAAKSMDPLRITPQMTRLVQVYEPWYRLMLVADSSGTIIAAPGARADGSFLDGQSLIGQSVVGERWFEVWRQREIRAGETFVEDVHIDSRVATLYGDEGYVIGFSHGIYDQQNTLIGVWLNLFDWNVANQILSEFEQRPRAQGAQTLHLYILDQSERVIAGLDQDEPLQLTLGQLRSDAHILRRGSSQGYSDYEGLGWSVVAVQELDEAFGVIRRQTLQTVFAALLSSVLVALIGMGAARRITRPVVELQRAAGRIASGDLQSSVPEGTDEIGQLGSAFNSMTAQLRALYGGLEQQVARRTAALESALAETNALYTTASALIRAENLDHVLQAVVDSVTMVLPADAVALFTVDVEARKVLHFVKGGAGQERLSEASFEQLWEGLSGWVIRERQPALSSKEQPDPRESSYIQRRRREMGNGSLIVVPLRFRNRILGTMTATNRLDQPDFTDRDVELMVALSNQAAVAIENARLYEAARRRAYEAETLSSAAAVVAATLDRDEAIARLLEQLALVVPHDSASVQLLEDDELVIVGGRGWDDLSQIMGIGFKIPGENPNTAVILERRTSIIDEVRDDPSASAFDVHPAARVVHSWMGVPLLAQKQVIGMISFDKAEPRFFTADHARLASAFADQVAIAIENAYLYSAAQQELAERRRAEAALRKHQELLEEQVAARTAELRAANEHLRQGVKLARDVQIGLLPATPPWPTEELEVFAYSLPAADIGGDFYSFLTSPQASSLVVLGDVSGKGVAAALMMALTSGAVETFGPQIREPAQLLSVLNQQLQQRLHANAMNAALLVLRIDRQRRKLTIANAGMVAPLLVRGGSVEMLMVGGLPLGSLPEISYQQIEVPLEDGDIIALASDGIVEAHNGTRQLYGFDRLEQVLSTNPTRSLDTLGIAVLTDVASFSGSADQHDDMTLVLLRPGEPEDLTPT